MVVDKTGRKLKIGQIVDVFVFGMFKAKVTDIKDQPIVLSADQQIQPHLVLACPITPLIRPDATVPDVYIIAEPDPHDPVVTEYEDRQKGLRLIKPV